MALFKTFRGRSENLPEIRTDGYCYFTTDNQMFYIDYKDENGEIQRAALNAGDAETILGASLETVLNYTDEEFPTSKAIIDELDKRIVQSDWAVNDETDAAYVKNRTHYESVAETEIIDINQRMTEIGNVWAVDESTIAYYGVCSIPLDSYDFNTNTGYGVVVNGINNKGQLTEVDFSPFGRTFIFGDWDGITSGESNAFALRLEERPDENIWSIEAFSVTDTPPTECRLLICEEQVVKLEKKFIPDEAFAQADWAETDETSVSFIKNKPAFATEEDILAMLAETGAPMGVSDADGSVFTDENGNILIM